MSTLFDRDRHWKNQIIGDDLCRLRRAGMDTTSICVAMRLYHDVELSYHQVSYYLRKRGVDRPRVGRRGRQLCAESGFLPVEAAEMNRD